MRNDIQFFERGLHLIKGNGDLKAAIGHLVQLAAESGNCTSSSFYIADWNDNVLKPLVTYGLPLLTSKPVGTSASVTNAVAGP